MKILNSILIFILYKITNLLIFRSIFLFCNFYVRYQLSYLFTLSYLYIYSLYIFLSVINQTYLYYYVEVEIILIRKNTNIFIVFTSLYTLSFICFYEFNLRTHLLPYFEVSFIFHLT